MDEYDAAQAKFAKMKSDYADHVAAQKERRKPALHMLAAACLMVIAWLLMASGWAGAALLVSALAAGAVYRAYRLRGRTS